MPPPESCFWRPRNEPCRATLTASLGAGGSVETTFETFGQPPQFFSIGWNTSGDPPDNPPDGCMVGIGSNIISWGRRYHCTFSNYFPGVSTGWYTIPVVLADGIAVLHSNWFPVVGSADGRKGVIFGKVTGAGGASRANVS